MSMDRHDRAWPGGPPAPAGYPWEGMGAKDPRFQEGSRLLDARVELLAICKPTPPDVLQYGSTWVEMTVPDGRMVGSLSIGFVPSFADGGPHAPFTIPDAKVHLMSMVDLGGEPLRCEDLIGAEGEPVDLVPAGLQAWQYSPTEEVERVRADLVLATPMGGSGEPVPGRWWARARWQALRPMSNEDWRFAVSMCQLLRGPALTLNYAWGG